MFEKMIEKEFELALDELTGRTHKIQTAIEKQVKSDLGYYELMAKIGALELELTELRNETKHLLSEPGSSVYSHSDSYKPRSPIGIEVTKRLVKFDGTADQVQKARDTAIKTLRLCGVTEDVSKLFVSVEKSLTQITKDIKTLPPVNRVLKQIGK